MLLGLTHEQALSEITTAMGRAPVVAKPDYSKRYGAHVGSDFQFSDSLRVHYSRVWSTWYVSRKADVGWIEAHGKTIPAAFAKSAERVQACVQAMQEQARRVLATDFGPIIEQCSADAAMTADHLSRNP